MTGSVMIYLLKAHSGEPRDVPLLSNGYSFCGYAFTEWTLASPQPM
jgi:hypothetical protein